MNQHAEGEGPARDRVLQTWEEFMSGVQTVAKEVFWETGRGPKKTLDLQRHHATNRKQGQTPAAWNIAQAAESDKEIRRSARKDRKKWVDEGLGDRLWDPVKLFAKKRSSRPVRLQKGG